MTARLIDAWRRSPLSRHPRLTVVKHVTNRSDLPIWLPRRQILLVGTPAKWAIMACPCGNGHIIDLNLAHPDLPQWKIDGRFDPSVAPSVDVNDPYRRCHFWVRHGRVTWIRHRDR